MVFLCSVEHLFAHDQQCGTDICGTCLSYAVPPASFQVGRKALAPAPAPVRHLGGEICWPPSRVRQTVRICAKPATKTLREEESLQFNLTSATSCRHRIAEQFAKSNDARFDSSSEVAYRLLYHC